MKFKLVNIRGKQPCLCLSYLISKIFHLEPIVILISNDVRLLISAIWWGLLLTISADASGTRPWVLTPAICLTLIINIHGHAKGDFGHCWGTTWAITRNRSFFSKGIASPISHNLLYNLFIIIVLFTTIIIVIMIKIISNCCSCFGSVIISGCFNLNRLN